MRSLSETIPYSAIRFNDGEAKLVATPELYGGQYLVGMLKRWFGYNYLSTAQLHELQRDVTDAVLAADFIGLPGADWPAEFAHANRIVDRIRADTVFQAGEVDFPQIMAENGAMDTLLAAAKRITLISCRDVRDYMTERYQVARPAWIPVPEQAIYRYGAKTARHFPEHYTGVLAMLESIKVSGLYLVGAGPCGKSYCAAVKRRGGVALDIGSLFDQWAGRSTRPRQRFDSTRQFLTQKQLNGTLNANDALGIVEILDTTEGPEAAQAAMEALRAEMPGAFSLLARHIALLLQLDRRPAAARLLQDYLNQIVVPDCGELACLGEIHRIGGALDVAASLFARGLHASPGDEICLQELCSLLCDRRDLASVTGDVAPNIDKWAAKVAARSDNYHLHFQLARLLGSRGDIKAAIAWCERAVALFPLAPDYFRQLAAWYAHVGDTANLARCTEGLRLISGPDVA